MPRKRNAKEMVDSKKKAGVHDEKANGESTSYSTRQCYDSFGRDASKGACFRKPRKTRSARRILLYREARFSKVVGKGLYFPHPALNHIMAFWTLWRPRGLLSQASEHSLRSTIFLHDTARRVFHSFLQSIRQILSRGDATSPRPKYRVPPFIIHVSVHNEIRG